MIIWDQFPVSLLHLLERRRRKKKPTKYIYRFSDIQTHIQSTNRTENRFILVHRRVSDHQSRCITEGQSAGAELQQAQMGGLFCFFFLNRHWQGHLPFASKHSCDIKVEEITVKDGLHHARHHCDLVEEALRVVAPQPVGDVEGSIEAEEEQVVGGDGLRFTSLCDHKKLRHYRHRLQKYGERPQDLQWGEGVVLQEGEPDDGHQQELHPERVVLRVVCVLKPHVDHVHGGIGQSQKHHLHNCVIGRNEDREQVQVPGGEYKCKQHL